MDAFSSERGDNVMAFLKESFEEHIAETPEKRVDTPALPEQTDLKIDTQVFAQEVIADDAGKEITNSDNQLESNISFNLFDVGYGTDDNGMIYSIDGEIVPNIAYVLDGTVYYTDDNGDIYRIDNELQPNTEYEINGYKYKTDEQGRIISAEGTLRMKDREGRLPIKDSIEDIGKGDQKDGDDRGHLIGDQFDGSNGLENMVPQDAKINRNDFKNFENELAKEVKPPNNKEVYVTIEPIYEGDSNRPVAIVATYKIDGDENVRVFPNGQEN